MRRLTTRIAALLLLVLLVPGFAEAAENLVHLATSGHFAHSAESGDTHDEPGPEHGCSGTLHLCACHGSVSGAFAAVSFGFESGLADGHLAQVQAFQYSAHLGNIEHPPQSHA